MTKKNISNAISNISNRHIEEAADFKAKAKKPVWVKLGAIAACLCLMVGILAIPRLSTHLTGTNDGTGQVQFLSEAEEMSVELVKWKKSGFEAVVVDVGNNSIFPLDGELSVEFGYDTEIILADGAVFKFNPDEPDTESIGWVEGAVIKVKFTEYDEYSEGNHFYNRLLANSVEVVTSDKD